MKRWSDEEDEKLRQLKALRTPDKAIAQQLGRTFRAVTARWEYINFSHDEKKHKQRMKTMRLSASRAEPDHIDFRRREFSAAPARNGSTIPPEVWAERDARLAAPKSLTGWMFGDPPRGFSAADRRACA